MNVIKAPERIYLQDDEGARASGEMPWEQTTWSEYRVDENDVEYVRADLAQRALPAAEAVEGLVKALVMVQDVERLQKEGKPAPLEFMYRKVNEALTSFREAMK